MAAIPASYAVGHLAISLVRRPGTFNSPVLVTNAGDGSNRLFVVEQGGRIKIIDGSTAIATPFLDIHTRVSCCGERGLLGLAFDPAFKTNRRFFVDYTDKNGDTIIASYRASATNPNLASTTQTAILKIDQPYSNHNGGMLAFGKDGYLYIGMGDGGSAGDPGNRAQNKNSLLGKILRIDINHVTSTRKYSNPPTNPFVGKAGSDRVWAYGFRNPWRFSFDRSTGDLWVGDVGQNRYEEVDRATKAGGAGKGRNYGWRVLEGQRLLQALVRLLEDRQDAPDHDVQPLEGLRRRGWLRLPRRRLPRDDRRVPVRRLLLRSDLGAQGERLLGADRRPAAQLGPDDQLIRRG